MAISLVNVVGGLYTWLTTDSDFNTAIGGSSGVAGRLYYGLAPKGAALPLVMYEVTANRDEIPTMSEASYAVTVEFEIVETKEAGPRACMDINDKLRDRLSRQTFTITGATMLAAALGVERGPVNVDQAYVQTVDYLIRGFAS
tara:strand:+ start:95 stop:523 length:429 start_codon:yes stop_codon:yes gene_type:complete